ncbi:hypothetical protein [Clostridium folliculivorans]|uniref:hypothetical protein n=1 Tax=Clostridium folliculivorans TaxID=2886038 RepID=UPI0021C3B2CA|nr:hypothetical protein [Clostridium folliculivorans]GKU30417.1 hypothetical protein CFB3_25240 [Clostridium folliculivorans]
MVKKKRKADDIHELCYDEEVMEENGIVDGEPIGGDVVRAFSFVTPKAEALLKNDTSASNTNVIKEGNIKVSPEVADNRKLKTIINDKTPAVDDEPLDLQRNYKLRESTARMLNEIKAAHPNVNVYMNTIVDAALRHYHNYIFNENGKFQ